MSDSPLTAKILFEELGIPRGHIFGKIFKATRGMEMSEALVVATQIRDGVWVAPERQSHQIAKGSVLEFFLSLPFIPSTTAPNPMWASKSDLRRMIDQGAISLNWHTDWNPDEQMPEIVTEITLFPNGKRCTTLFII